MILLLAACSLPTYQPPPDDPIAGCVAPGEIEACDQRDNDCDGRIDEGLDVAVGYRDADGDGLAGTEFTSWTCADVSQWGDLGLFVAPDDTECDDTDPGLPALRYVDLDADGSGTDPVWTCQPDALRDWPTEEPWVPDCDDTDPDVFPLATEVCGDGKVNGCVVEDEFTEEDMAADASANCRVDAVRASQVEAGVIPRNDVLVVLDIDGDGLDDAFGGPSAIPSADTHLYFWVLWGAPEVAGSDVEGAGFPLDASNLWSSTYSASSSSFLEQDADQLLIGGNTRVWVLMGMVAQWQLLAPLSPQWTPLQMHGTHIGPRVPGGPDQIAVWQERVGAEGGAVWLLGPDDVLGQPQDIDLLDADREPDLLDSGVTLHTAGDMDGDGVAELLFLDSDQHVISTDGVNGWTWTAPAPTDWTQSTTADLNGDGHGDVVVGSEQPLATCDDATGGAVLVSLGQSGPPTHAVLQSAHRVFASQLTGGMDMDQDGMDEVTVAASANSDDLGPALHVLWGHADWTTGSDPCDPIAITVSGTSGTELGTRVGVGDMDGDGLGELVGLAGGSGSGNTLQVFNLGGY